MPGANTEPKSNEAGNYTIAQLKEGPYSLQVAAPGFKEYIAADIALKSVGEVMVKLADRA